MKLIIWTLFPFLMFVLVYCDDVSLSKHCSDIARRPLTSIISAFNNTLKCRVRRGFVACQKSKQNENFETYLRFEFKILDVMPDINNTGDLSHCVGLQMFTYAVYATYQHDMVNSYLTLSFNPWLAVGVRQTGTGSSDVNILNAILGEELFSLTPLFSDYFSWNFSSPLFRREQRWLQKVEFGHSPTTDEIMNKFENKKVRSLIDSLQNTSIESLHLFNVVINEHIQLKDMPFLTKIDIERSYILNISNDNFIRTPGVTYFRTSSCKMRGLPDIGESLPNLQTVKISEAWGFDVFNIGLPNKKLSGLTQLETLLIFKARVFSISDKFPQLPKLKELTLQECYIAKIGENDLRNFPALEKLDLSGNFIFTFDRTTFFPLFLKRVVLSQNNLTTWPMPRSCSLSLLNLAENSLNYIENLGNLGTTVEYLDLAMNELQEWKDNAVFSWKDPRELWVKNINLSKNAIEVLSEVMMESLNGIQEIDLGGNPFTCADCRIKPFQVWLNTTSIKINNLGTSNPLLCSFPVKNEGVPLVEVEVDEELCYVKYSSLWISLGTFFGLVFVIVFTVSGIVYKFQSRITYMLHLYRIRNRAKHFCETSYSKFAFDAFICYSSHDRNFVLKHLAPALEKGPEKYVLCLHERDFPLGSRIVENIEGSIEHSRKTIIVLSEHFIESKWCNWELEMANHKMFQEDEHFLILIQLQELDRSKLPRHLQFLMDTRTYLEWPLSERKDEEELCKRLKKALGPSIFQKINDHAPQFSDLMNSDDVNGVSGQTVEE